MRILATMAKISFAGFLVSLAIGLLAGFGTRLGFWNFKFGLLTLFPWCLYIGIAAFVIGLAWVVSALVANNGAGARYGLIGLVGSAIVLALPLYDIYVAKTSPPIHDITTDMEHPPQFDALLPLRKGALNGPEYDGPKLVAMPDGKKYTTSYLQRKYYGDIHTVAILTPPEKLFNRALEAAKAMGWNIVAVAPDEGRIEATDTSFFFGFTDDIVIRVKPSGMGAKLDIRSKSRVGVSDVGKNAARIREYEKTLARTSG
ncbi:MAG TPA: DUF1499 domain-containing protein [Rhizomicrobium sp.]|nr:DUF1499 domain-containing protein [Rhizomicrobium sp.]